MADSFLQDIRYALRTLRRAPLFPATVAATMGLGLGLLGSVFTIANAYLFKPIDLPNPHTLYSLSWDTGTTRRQRFTLADYEALQPEVRTFAGAAAAQDVTVMRDTVRMDGILVTGNYFELLGARPLMGRLLGPGDVASRGRSPVVVLSYNAWRSRYGADPDIVGQRIPLGRQRFEVIGVTEPGAFLPGQALASFWAPLTMAGALPGVDPWSHRDAATLTVITRLKPDMSAASVRAWFDLWLRRRFPAAFDASPPVVRVDSLATRLNLDDGATLGLFVFLMSAFGLVLLVASANVTNLMLARALARQPEIAVRLALGSSRWRVARQLIVESLVLALPAAAAGLALIFVTARAFPALVLATFPPNVLPVENVLVPLDPDWRVMAFLAGAAVLSAVLITLAPAGRLAATRLAHASRGEASSDRRGSRLRSGLVAAQIGACALFLVGSMGLLNESWRLSDPLPNIDYDRISFVRTDATVRPEVAARIASHAEVEQIAFTSKPPGIAGALPTTRVTASTTSRVATTGYTLVSPEYFRLFDIQILQGRAFTPDEVAAGASVALVSKATAAALWPGLNPVGQTLDLGAAVAAGPPRGAVRIIGVTEDVANGAILEASVDRSCVYFPADSETLPGMWLLVRTSVNDVETLRSAVAGIVKEIAPDTTFDVMAMRTILGTAVWIFQAFWAAASLLAIVALIFAYSGTHAVVSFLVAQRRREFGVRMALGASAWQIVRGMLIETSRTASVGVLVGLAVAAALIRLLSRSNPIVPNFGISPFVVGAVVVLAATTVAALFPLRGAARIDPAQALRAE